LDWVQFLPNSPSFKVFKMWSILFQFQLGLILIGIIGNSAAVVVLPKTLEKKLAESGSATIFITLSESPLSICTSAKSEAPDDLIRKLKKHALETQKSVLDVLHLHGVRNYHSYWISNRVYVPQCAAEVISVLQLDEGVSEIREERHFPLEPIRRSPTAPKSTLSWGKRINYFLGGSAFRCMGPEVKFEILGFQASLQ